MKKFVIILLAVLMMLVLPSCGAKKSADKAASTSAPKMEEAGGRAESDFTVEKPAQGEASQEAVGQERKIIYTAFTTIDVKDLKGAYDSAISKAGEMGGYVASSSIRDAYSEITVRIPAARLDEYLKYLDTLGGESKETSVSTNDVTEQYTDTESRLRNLKAQEEQLLSIMKKAVTVEDTLKVQNELYRVRGEIESLQGKINMWDKLIEFSTVTVKLNKVLEIGGKDVKVSFISFDEIAKGMSNGFKTTLNLVIRFVSSIFVFAVSVIPLVPFIGIIAWVVIRYGKKIKNNISR